MDIKAGIIGVGSYVPKNVITNSDLEKIMDTSDEWIKTRTGISERRIVSELEATSDMASKAALNAISNSKINVNDIDMIIVATVTPDSPLPSTACIVQEKIGATNAIAFDLAAACSGFLYAMNIAKRFVESKMYNNILLIGAETLSSVVNYDDRSTAVLFGDGAGAAIISKVEEGGILSIINGADGTGKDYLKIPAGGSRIKAGEYSIKNKLHSIKMSGNDVFKFAVRKMLEESVKAIEKAKLSLEDIDFLIPHQANIRIIESSAKRLGLKKDKVYVNLTRYGNMSSASIPVAMDEAFREGKIKKGDKIVLVGFGGGLTWGSSVVQWSI